MPPASAPTDEAVGRSLRTLRQLAGLTLEDVARIAETSVAYLSKVETGKFVPSKTYVRQVTTAIARSMGETAAA